MTATMKAAVMYEAGGPEVLKIRTAPSRFRRLAKSLSASKPLGSTALNYSLAKVIRQT